MPEIRVMPDSLASQVAAGEVVERPESVVRELVDNALDAGARQVEVAIERAGRALIRVTDDGSGMSREDALLSLERHATSKILKVEDLAHVATLGFRGEALPSIASVSRFRLFTREHGAVAGTCIQVEGGVLKDVREEGGAPGTRVEVRDLFANVPARRKFLRTDATEVGHVDQRLRLLAAAHPGVGFVFRKDGREVFRLPAGTDRRERVRALVSGEAWDKLGELAAVGEGDRVEGYLTPAGWSRPSGGMVWFFLNGRPVVSPILKGAVADAYEGLLPRGGHPACVLFLRLDHGEFDINVHPAKREVRFLRPSQVRMLVGRALRRHLEEATGRRRPLPGVGDKAEVPRPAGSAGPGGGCVAAAAGPSSSHRSSRDPVPPVDERTPPPVEPTALPSPPPDKASGESRPPAETGVLFPDEETDEPLATSRHVGSLHERYELFEVEDGLVLLERRAAVERILFEWLAERRGTESVSQNLLFPVTLELEQGELEGVEPHLKALQELGISVERFGGRSLLLSALPAAVKVDDPGKVARLVLEAVRAVAVKSRGPVENRALMAAVSRELSRGGRALPEYGPGPKLLQRLLECEMPYCCPRGRPTLVQLGRAELARRFGLDG